MSVSMVSQQLVKAGIDCSVFTTTANGAHELPVKTNEPVNVDGVTVTYFKRLTKDHTHFSPALLIKLWREVKKYDVVHLHAWWNTVSVLSCFIAVVRGVPAIVSPRGTLSSYSFQNKNTSVKYLIHQFLGRPLLNRCRIHVTSIREQKAISDLIEPKSITVVPNFVKLPDNPIQTTHEPNGPLRLLFFSRIEEKKGLDILINALKNVTIAWYLTVAGTGDTAYIDQLKNLAADNHIADKINWAGFFDHDKFDMLSEHDLFILPSHDENFANTVIESLGVGTAVLISENVGLYDYVEQNNLGWICQVNQSSVTRLINKIGTEGHNDLTRIRKDAPAIIYNDFDADKLVEKYIAMYNQTLCND